MEKNRTDNAEIENDMRINQFSGMKLDLGWGWGKGRKRIERTQPCVGFNNILIYSSGPYVHFNVRQFHHKTDFVGLFFFLNEKTTTKHQRRITE